MGYLAAQMDGARYLGDHEDRMAWIMGSSRSGSTWLLRMLNELSQVAKVDDPHLGHHLGVWRPVPLAWAAAEQRPELKTLNEIKAGKDDYFFNDRHRDAWLPALRDLIRARFGAHIEESPHPEPRLVVKEPGSHAARLIFDAFPQSKLIFLLRDGRDVVDSWMDAYQPGSWAIDGGAFAVAEHGRRPLVEWLSSVWSYRVREVGSVYGQRPASARVMIRYERLLEDPVGELARICSLLDLDADRATLTQITERNAFDAVDDDRRGSLREVRAAQPGAWKRNLSADERQAMDEIMATELEAWGYGDTAAVA